MTKHGMSSSVWLGSLGLKLSRIASDSSMAMVIRGSWLGGWRMGCGESALASIGGAGCSSGTSLGALAELDFRDGGFERGSERLEVLLTSE